MAQNDKAKTHIGIPTPALSEALVRSGATMGKVLEKIKEFSVFEILPFDELSAIEVAIVTKNAIDEGDKKSGSHEVWAKVKSDRQIVAIARVHQARAIYTDDGGLRNVASQLNMPTIGISDLPLPPKSAQGILPLEAPMEHADEPTFEEIEQAREAETAGAGAAGSG